VRDSSEEITKMLKDDLEIERQRRRYMDNWLKEKFFVESQNWHKKWTALLRQIEANRDNLDKVTVSFSVLFCFVLFCFVVLLLS
jgi:hypothetical protein